MSNTRGRPTKYRPEFCELVIEQGKLGKSVVQMAAACGVWKSVILDWAREHEDFSAAINRAKAESQNWWETVAQTHMIEEKDAARLNAGIWSRSMAARFPDDYTEKNKTELTGAGGGPIKGLNVTFVDSATK